jgi:DNA-binding MarR family transcriptional regulator
MNQTDRATYLIESLFKISRWMKGQAVYRNDICQLTMLQLQTLLFVKQHNNTPMTEIAKHFNIELPSATSLVEKLCKAGLAERKADPKDRRLVRISLTQQGTSFFEEAMKERLEKTNIILSYLSEEDKEDLMRIVDKLMNKMEVIHES